MGTMELEVDKATLKASLVKELRPLTEADPDVLSDYIIALLENSTDPVGTAQFESQMAGKLEDFLGSNTEKFVRVLERIVQPGRQADPEVAPSRKRPFVQQKVCNNWKKGYCPRGNACKFSHPMTIAEDLLQAAGFPPLPSAPLPHHKAAPLAHQQPRPLMPRARNNNNGKIIIDKIPPDYCNIAAVHGHFSQFGTIVNIDLMPELGRARLQYSKNEESQAAHDSPEVIFNNRFVKVYWDDTSDAIPLPVRPVPPQQRQQLQQQQRPVNPQEELARKRKETLQAYLDLQKQKESLLAKYIEQQKVLLAKLEAPDLDDQSRTKLIEELRVVDSAINTVKPPPPAADTQRTAVALRQPILKGGPVAPKTPVLPVSSYKLDLRPKTIKMTPIPPKLGTEPAGIRKFFEPYGQVTNLAVDTEAGYVRVTYLRRQDAEKAMHYLPKAEGDTVTFTWEPSTTSTN